MESNAMPPVLQSDGASSSTGAQAPLLIHAEEAPFVKSDQAASSVLLEKLSDNFKSHLDKAMAELKDQQARDFEKVLTVMQQESVKRTALEQHLHSHLLLQNEYMVAMELKLLRLEAKLDRREMSSRHQQQQQQPYQSQLQQQQQQARYYSTSNHRLPTTFTTIDEVPRDHPTPSNAANIEINEPGTPHNMAVISSGASLASGVTAGSFLADDNDETHEEGDEDDDNDDRTDTGESDPGTPVVREFNDHESQQSTPTVGSTRPRVAVGVNGNLESILLNPMIGESDWQGMMSVRATRGQDTDGNSSLATSVTNSTYTSTVVTATTRGDSSTIHVRRIVPEGDSEVHPSDFDVDGSSTPSRRGRSSTALPGEDLNIREEPRSRSQSPLTVNTHASDTNMSFASASTVGTSIRSSAAVAPSSSVFARSRTLSSGNNNNNASMMGSFASIASLEMTRPLADRVVSFTPELTMTNLQSPAYPVEASTDSIASTTMPPDDLIDAVANNARVWREEYEARLDALHKRWSNE